MGRGEAVRAFTNSSPATSFTVIFELDFTRIHISMSGWRACVSAQKCASLMLITLVSHIVQQYNNNKTSSDRFPCICPGSTEFNVERAKELRPRLRPRPFLAPPDGRGVGELERAPHTQAGLVPAHKSPLSRARELLSGIADVSPAPLSPLHRPGRAG